MKTVAILMSVHGNREKTMETLESCMQQMDAFKAAREYEFTVYLTLDNCSESMADAISQSFPQVKLVYSPELLYWSNGLSLAWTEASHNKFDFYLWVRKGVRLIDNSIAVLLENSFHLRDKAILAGTVATTSGIVLKGGRTKSGKLITPDPIIPVACETFDGDLVLVPQFVFSRLGTMDKRFVHCFGDYDYGVRAQRMDITVAVAPGVLATRDGERVCPVWRDSSKTLKERYAAISGPEGRPFKERFIYDMRRGGVLFAVLNFISQLMMLLFPKHN